MLKTEKQKRSEPSRIDLARRSQWLEWLSLGLLFLLGVYLAIVYFEQKAVPNSDFPAFVQVGREIAHFQMPSSFKRVPVLGLLQLLFSKFVFNSLHPVFTAGLILNGVFYCLSILIFYKICRFLWESAGAFCLSLVAALNPWTLAMMVDPIVETTFVFFMLLTVYFILRRSWWCYLFAMIASMTRYECFALIGIAFLIDLILRKSKREKIKALGLSCLAAVPMLLWLIAMKIQPSAPGGHYFRVFLNVEHRNGVDLFKMLWQTSFSSLLQWHEWVRAFLVERAASREEALKIAAHNDLFHSCVNITAAFFFVFGAIFTVIRKQWGLLSVLLFWLVYVFVHSMQSVLLSRYTVPVIWLTLFLTAYGLKTALGFISGRIGEVAVNAVLVSVAVIALIWFLQILPWVSKTAAISPASHTVVYVGLLVMACFFIVKKSFDFRSHWICDISIFMCVGLFIVSNQYSLAWSLGRGDTDVEFKKLAQWYAENAKEGESWPPPCREW